MAYNIMIVDDLISDRTGLEEIISNYQDLGVVVRNSLSNGNDALVCMEKQLPDIVICDLDMPVMNGFELTKEIKRKYPSVKVIFCSHYQNFEYARNALYLDNYGYVTKPVDSAELYRVLEDTIAYISKEKKATDAETALLDAFERNKPLLQNHFLKDLIFAQYSNKEELPQHFTFWGLPVPVEPYRLVLVEVDDFQQLSAALSINTRQVIAARILNTLRNAISNTDRLICQIDESHFAVLLMGSEKVAPEAVSGLIFSAFRKSDISLTIAVSDQCKTLDGISKLTEQCYYTLRFKYSLGKGRTILYSDLKNDAALPQTDLNKVQQDIAFMINSGDGEALSSYFVNIFSPDANPSDPIYCKKLCFDIAVCLQNILLEKKLSFEHVVEHGEFVWGKLSKFETLSDAKEYLIGVAEQCTIAIRALTEQKEMLLAKQVKNVVYASDLKTISIGSIASELHYSADHLNYLFRKATGETISEFITKYRISLAKKLLENPALKLYQIADQLGYSHTSYLTSIFKRYEGLSPREYREIVFQAKTSEKGELQ